MAKWLDESHATAVLMNHIHAYLYTTNKLERDDRAEWADEGGGGVLWPRGAGKARILGIGAGERAALGKEIVRVCGNAVGELPCLWTHSMRRYHLACDRHDHRPLRTVLTLVL